MPVLILSSVKKIREAVGFPRFLVKLVSRVGKQSDLSCSLYSFGKFSLVHSTGAGYAAGKNLSSFADILSEFCNIFIIYRSGFVSTELANSLLGSSFEVVFSFHFSFAPFVNSFRKDQNGRSSSISLISAKKSFSGIFE